jgi:hypothetical protein
MMWAEMKYLTKLKPFNFGNLTDHVEKNPTLWHELIEAETISFEDLPNNGLLNLKQFALIDVKLIASKQNEEGGSDGDSSEEERLRKKKEKEMGRPKISKQVSSRGGLDSKGLQVELELLIDSDENKPDGGSSDGERQTALGDGEVSSMRGSRRGNKNFTEADILADHSIWGISDDEDEDNHDD